MQDLPITQPSQPSASTQQAAPEGLSPENSTPDVLSQATQAIATVIPQTTQNPHARLDSIAAIRASYINARFGV